MIYIAIININGKFIASFILFIKHFFNHTSSLVIIFLFTFNSISFLNIKYIATKQITFKIESLCDFLIFSFDFIDFIEQFAYDYCTKNRKGDIYMFITETELKMNLGKYLLMAETEDIYITKNGKTIAKLTNPNQDRVDIAKSLFGIIPADFTLDEVWEERLNQI